MHHRLSTMIPYVFVRPDSNMLCGVCLILLLYPVKQVVIVAVPKKGPRCTLCVAKRSHHHRLMI